MIKWMELPSSYQVGRNFFEAKTMLKTPVYVKKRGILGILGMIFPP
jgi:hypothetical protein